MRNLKIFLIIILCCICKRGYTQSTDSLNISPNPFNTSTTVYFWLANDDTVSVEMYNMVGQNVRTILQDSLLNAGAYSINVPTDTLAFGIYVVRLNIGSNKGIYKKAIKASTTGVKENIGEQAQGNVWPNPVNDLLNISVTGDKKIIVTSLDGRIVKRVQVKENAISLAGLDSGTYLISVFSEDNELLFSERIIKSTPE